MISFTYQLTFVLLASLFFMTSCGNNSVDNPPVHLPEIIEVKAPEILEIPDVDALICEVENRDSFDFQIEWEVSSGHLIPKDSTTIYFQTPPRASEITVTCTVLDSTQIFDQKTANITAVLPDFVGDYSLKSIQACDSTFTADKLNSDSPRLLFKIFDTHTTGKGFAYSWKVSYEGLPEPENCRLQLSKKTHNGFAGKHKNEDDRLFLSIPVQLGYFVEIVTWTKSEDRLIFENSSLNERWIFQAVSSHP
ncbi:MAG: hypothetical protein ACFCU6_00380 [Balneolaceae bacterium]